MMLSRESIYSTLEIPDGTPKPWTSIPYVVTEINRRISGHRKRDCFDFFALKYPGRRFERALFLNRTDFRLEHRLYFDMRLFASAIAIHERHLPLPAFNARYSNANASAVLGGKNGAGDIGVWFNGLSQHADLAIWELDLDSAERAWLARHGQLLLESPVITNPVFDLPVTRFQVSETGQLPEGPFDLVINYLGSQSIAYPDRIFRELCRQMAPDGVMMNYAYIGPHRYQYSSEHWESAVEVSRQLPDNGKQEMVYPRLSEMLARDPTDAVHSELTLPIMKRYFTLHSFRAAGGAIAHPIISQNKRLFGFIGGFDDIVADIMATDWDYLCEHPDSSLFAYWIAKPNHASLDDVGLLAEFTREEEEREEVAHRNWGYYYPQTPLHRSLYPYDTLKSAMNGVRGKVRSFLRIRN
jgi:hypothetical protein